MMKQYTTIFLVWMACISLYSQEASISGQLLDGQNEPIPFANVALSKSIDTSLVKVEVSDDEGYFKISGLLADEYLLAVTYVGFQDVSQKVELSNGEQMQLGSIEMLTSAVDLQTATVKASRSIVEVKSDRTIFNVEGTINSAGDNAIGLLRKAPGVLVDNNENITVLSRSGVLVYIDGKRLPLEGDDLAAYLKNIPAEQIDRMDIITNPGAKYEAEGNAGIIDIRLKKNKDEGANGTISTGLTQGIYFKGNINASGNYRSKRMNVFANGGYSDGVQINRIEFESFQNGLVLNEYNRFLNQFASHDFRAGADFFLNENNTIGLIVSGNNGSGESFSYNRTRIRSASSSSTMSDSILVADNSSDRTRGQQTYNINYRYAKDETSVTVDADYGRYTNTSVLFQPNRYYDGSESTLLSENINSFDTPRDIDIYTFKLDYETGLGKGKFGAGTKLSNISTDNTFLFYNVLNGQDLLNSSKSNRFDYDEMVYAGYLSYNSPLSDKWSMSAGLRMEVTDAKGDLTAYDASLQEDPVELNYVSFFPSLGVTHQISEKDVVSFNYGRRINRPDYNVLNPFNNQLSELSFEKGNPFLKPEIVNNLEIGYTLNYMYNFKIAYSRTIDQITRLIGPSEEDVRASFINWDNLATQTIFSANVSAPIQVTPAWNAYLNLSGSHLDNQADYGGNAIVDVKAWTYTIFQQHTINLPNKFKGEISGWFSGPGVWGGVFRYETSWSLNLGIQRKFLQDKLSVKLSAQDVFYQSGWDGYSEFNGLVSTGSGRWDSRVLSLSMSYNFGNQNVRSKKRNTGLEDESKRVGQ